MDEHPGGGMFAKRWLKATVHTTTQGAEALAPLLERFGISSYSVEDPSDMAFLQDKPDAALWDSSDEGLFSLGSGGEVLVSFFLEPGGDTDSLLEAFRQSLMKLKADEQYGVYGEGASFGRLWLETSEIVDDWVERYREYFHTFSPCDGIVVRPPWELGGATGDAIEITIEPGMAFGTGTHETTALCLERLMIELEARPGARLLDAGTGSGILAIAAALAQRRRPHQKETQGCFPKEQDSELWTDDGGCGNIRERKILAVEIDEDAAASARGNIEKNGVAGDISLIVGDITRAGTLSADSSFDIIVANLTYVILRGLLPTLLDLLCDGGVLIVSGILDAQEDVTKAALEEAGFAEPEIVGRGEWLMLAAGKAIL